MSDDALAPFRRWHRQDYLRRHAQQRRAAAREAGARRIDVTLTGEALDNYAEVRAWLEEINEHCLRINRDNAERFKGTGRNTVLVPRRLSDPEVIRAALELAANKIADESL
jgi:hypothetical protein